MVIRCRRDEGLFDELVGLAGGLKVIAVGLLPAAALAIVLREGVSLGECVVKASEALEGDDDALIQGRVIRVSGELLEE